MVAAAPRTEPRSCCQQVVPAVIAHPHRPEPQDLEAAAAYSARHRGLALLVLFEGETLLEHHAPDHPANQALPIASGTKSLTGILAATAAADGFLDLEEPVARSLEEWRDDPRRSRITPRQLLQLISGLEGGAKVGQVPSFEVALRTRAVATPGERFFYGAAPFQVLGEVLRRKLAALCPDPLDYLYGRVLDRIGMRVGRWRRGNDGWPDLSSGATLTAREWAKLGEWIRQDGQWDGREMIPAGALQECFRGSQVNPAYGLGWWLNADLPATARAHLQQAILGVEDLAAESAVPRDLVYAAGAGKQRLYISRQRGLVVVRQAAGILEALAGGERSAFSDCEFWRRLSGTWRS